MTDVISFMDTSKADFNLLPDKIKAIVKRAEALGFCNFWYRPKSGLYADAPNGSIEDDRMLITDEMLDWYDPTKRNEIADEHVSSQPAPDEMRGLAQQLQRQVDGALFRSLLGAAAAATSTIRATDEGLTLEKLEQTVRSFLSAVTPHDQALMRLAERLKREPTIRYISDEWIPGGTADGMECFWWEQHDVLLIAAASFEQVKQQMAQQGITLILVDDDWWREVAEKDLQNWLRPHLPKTI